MKRTLVFASCLLGITLSHSAFADVLTQNVREAKTAWENSKQITASAAARKKEKTDALVAKQKVIKELGAAPALPSGGAPPPLGCDVACTAAFGNLRAADGTIDPEKLPSEEICESVATRAELTGANPPAWDKIVFPNDSGERKALLLAVCSPTTSGDDCKKRLDVVLAYVKAAAPLRTAIDAAELELARTKQNEARDYDLYRLAASAETLAGEEPVNRLADRLSGVRRARCATAYCWGGSDGRKYAIEPTVDLPIGMYWAAGGGSLASYVNANNIKIHATAGLRYWFAYDAMSVGILLAQPELTESQTTIDYRDKTLATSQMRRPYPTLVVGFWGDIIQLSVSYDELRNAARSSGNYIQDYSANAVLARAVTFGVALNPVTAARNGIGASVSTKETEK
jgi:hypothetical protein